MKRTFLILLVLALTLGLAACERPLREDEMTQEAPDVPLVVSPMPTLGIPVEAPSGSPLPAEGLPAVPGGEGAAPADATAPGEAPADAGEPAGTVPPEGGEVAEPTTPEGNIIHTVQSGDTLFSLGQRYGVTVDEMMRANNLVNPNVLDVGQQLIIPVAGLPAEEGAAAGERTHVVVAGDTLFRIGQLYGFTVDELAQYNSLANPNDLDVGQVIRIPPDP